MPDPAGPHDSTTPAPPADHQTPGEFNQAQLETIRKSEGIARSAEKDTYLPTLLLEGREAATPEALLTKAREWRDLSRRARAATLTKVGDTGEGQDAAMLLRHEVEYLRGKARLKLTKNPAWTDNEVEAFKARYFINQNIYTSRALTEQSVDALFANAAGDALPGATPARLTAAGQRLADYVNTKDPQTGAQTDATRLRELRDLVFDEVMRLRHEIQFAADTACPWHGEANQGLRREFLLPAGRAFTG